MKRNLKSLSANAEGALAQSRSGIALRSGIAWRSWLSSRSTMPGRRGITRLSKIGTVCLILILSAGTVWAQTENRTRVNDLSINATVENYRNDFSLGARITSPYLLWNHLAFTAAANLTYREGALDTNPGQSVWIPYGVYRLGVIGTSGLIANDMRFYGHGGFVFILPDKRFSTSKFLWGGFGTFGFEFFVTPAQAVPISYFIELGSNGIKAAADLMVSDPIYVNGFSSTVGLKFYL
jgi:hypothetical protein